MVSGFFGMNLLSGIELAPHFFWGVMGSSMIFSAALFATCFTRFRSANREKGMRINDAQAFKRVFQSVEKVALLLRSMPHVLQMPAREMQEQVRALHQRVKLPGELTLTPKEVEMMTQMLRDSQPVTSGG